MSSASIRETVARTLVRLLEAYSPSGSETEAVKVFTELARELGYYRIWIDEAGNAHAVTAAGSPVVALMGHIDTVPGKIPVSRKNGIIRGRGAVDAKAALASFLVAGVSEGLGDCAIQVSALLGEEADSPGARFLVEKRFYVPFIIVGEPTNTTGIAIGYRGSALLRIQCKGEGGHSSSPNIGDSALEKFLESFKRLENLMGISATIVELHSWAPTRNVLPLKAYGYVDLRLSVEINQTINNLKNLIGSALADGCIAQVESYTPPVKVRPQDPVPRSLGRALLKLGIKPKYVVKRGTSDMNLLYPSCTGSIAAYGPGDAKLAHTKKEAVSENDLALSVKILAKSLRSLCRTTNSESS